MKNSILPQGFPQRQLSTEVLGAIIRPSAIVHLTWHKCPRRRVGPCLMKNATYVEIMSILLVQESSSVGYQTHIHAIVSG